MPLLFGCASTDPAHPNETPDERRLRLKYEQLSTSQLQLKRQQIAESIPDMEFKIGPFGPSSSGKKREKDAVEMELLRRYEAGDQTAKLEPLPKRDAPKIKGGNF